MKMRRVVMSFGAEAAVGAASHSDSHLPRHSEREQQPCNPQYWLEQSRIECVRLYAAAGSELL